MDAANTSTDTSTPREPSQQVSDASGTSDPREDAAPPTSRLVKVRASNVAGDELLCLEVPDTTTGSALSKLLSDRLELGGSHRFSLVVGSRLLDFAGVEAFLLDRNRPLEVTVVRRAFPLRVLVRVRPMSRRELAKQCSPEPAVWCEENGRDVRVRNPSSADTTGDGSGHGGEEEWRFQVDRTLGPEASQVDVFEEVRPLVAEVFQGGRASVLAYGQLGAGKTFTMEGSRVLEDSGEGGVTRVCEDPGVYVRVLEELLRLKDEREREGEEDIHISLSCLQLYNEELWDLLATEPRRIEVKMNSDRTCVAVGLTESAIHSVEEGRQALREAWNRKAVRATAMGWQVTRSTQIVEVKVVAVHRRSLQKQVGKISLVDLVSSSRVGRTGAGPGGCREAALVSRCLMTLGKVLQGILSEERFVPYRDSKLTMLLKDTIADGSKTLLILPLSPSSLHFEESLSSLRWASRLLRL